MVLVELLLCAATGLLVGGVGAGEEEAGFRGGTGLSSERLDGGVSREVGLAVVFWYTPSDKSLTT